jgi:hypothetical protein
MISGWKEEIQRDYLTFLREHPKATPSELATHLNLSEGFAIYWLTDLAREGKVWVTGVELVEEDTASFEPQIALTPQRTAVFPVSEPVATPFRGTRATLRGRTSA